MAKPIKRTAGMVPRPFIVEKHVVDAGDRCVADSWSVTQGKRRRFCTKLAIQVTTTSDNGRTLEGVGLVVTITRGEIVIIP